MSDSKQERDQKDQDLSSGAELEGGERLQRAGEGPSKQHGDALQTGTGTRHGVTEADERPES